MLGRLLHKRKISGVAALMFLSFDLMFAGGAVKIAAPAVLHAVAPMMFSGLQYFADHI